jgi:hypothetical protein
MIAASCSASSFCAAGTRRPSGSWPNEFQRPESDNPSPTRTGAPPLRAGIFLRLQSMTYEVDGTGLGPAQILGCIYYCSALTHGPIGSLALGEITTGSRPTSRLHCCSPLMIAPQFRTSNGAAACTGGLNTSGWQQPESHSAGGCLHIRWRHAKYWTCSSLLVQSGALGCRYLCPRCLGRGEHRRIAVAVRD